MKGRPIEILIFGTGAVGATLGWRLAQNPLTRVSAVCRSNYERVKRNGIQMRTKMWGSGAFFPDRVVRNVEEIKQVPFDYVVCASKVTSSDRFGLMESIRPVVGSKTTLVSVQNGINVEHPLKAAFNGRTILSAICYISCQHENDSVHQVSQIRSHAFHIGVYDGNNTNTHLNKSKLETLVRLDTKFKAIQDVHAERWTKAIFNGSWNPVTALTGFDTHHVLNDPLSLAAVQDLAEEIYEVAIKSGATLPADIPSRTIAMVRNASPIIPSMLQDARNGRGLEIEPVCGNILRQADAIGVLCPKLRETYQSLLKLDETIRSQAHSNSRLFDLEAAVINARIPALELASQHAVSAVL